MDMLQEINLINQIRYELRKNIITTTIVPKSHQKKRRLHSFGRLGGRNVGDRGLETDEFRADQILSRVISGSQNGRTGPNRNIFWGHTPLHTPYIDRTYGCSRSFLVGVSDLGL